MDIVIIDGQGGGFGRALIEALRAGGVTQEIVAVGTNALATSAMLKAGADAGATGENAVAVCCRRADLIVGPIGIVIADALLGEITPKMAVSVGQSRARRILIPVNHCDNRIAGVTDLPMGRILDGVLEEIRRFLGAAD